eukprot:12254727-Alexandrium_andersonii.AAC.1
MRTTANRYWSGDNGTWWKASATSVPRKLTWSAPKSGGARPRLRRRPMASGGQCARPGGRGC